MSTPPPAAAKSWHQRALDLADAGDLLKALAAMKKAIRQHPADARAHHNLATLLIRKGDTAAALEAWQQAIRLQPDYLAPRLALAQHWARQGDLKAAHQAFAEAARIASDPTAWIAWHDATDRQQGDATQESILNQALRAYPTSTALWRRYAAHCINRDDPEGARRAYGQALALDSRDVAALCGALLTLPRIPLSAEDFAVARRRYAQGLAALRERLPALLPYAQANPEAIERTAFFLAYHGENDRDLQSQWGDIAGMWFTAALPQLPPARPSGAPRLRVGFASRFFYASTVGYYFRAWICGLDSERFEVRVYLIDTPEDDFTERLTESGATLVRLSGTLAQQADRLLTDRLDLLIYPELGMHARTLSLAALRLAPIQCAAWGHPVTTGLATIDHYFSCAAMEPPDATQHYREPMTLLPGLGTCYRHPGVPSDIGQRSHFGLPEGRVLVLYPQSLFKIHPDNDALVVRLLTAAPHATLVMFQGQSPSMTRIFTARLQAAFKANGLATQDRIKLLPNVDHLDYLRVNQHCDFMLDTLHWSGGNTSLDAIACGLPILTTAGRFMRGRQSAAMLHLIGCGEDVAPDPDALLQQAIHWASNPAARAAARERIRAGRARLFDQAAPMEALQAALLALRATIPDLAHGSTLANNHNALGNVLRRSGALPGAVDAFGRAIALDPKCREAHVNLADTLYDMSRIVEAEAVYRMTAERFPADWYALRRQGHCLNAMWRRHEAEAAFRAAIAAGDPEPDAAHALIYLYKHRNASEAAVAIARDLAARDPGDLQALVARELMLPTVYKDRDAVLAARTRYLQGLDALEAALPEVLRRPEQVFRLAWENFHLAYQGEDDRRAQERYARLLSACIAEAGASWKAPLSRRAIPEGQRIRVGFWSSFFRDCTAGKYFRSWVEDLDRQRFEVFVYYASHVDDPLVTAIREASEHYRRIIGPAPLHADAIRRDALDILIYPEIGMDVAGYLLANLRLAPVQLAAWGHPVTTGATEIDGFLTCAEMEPPDAATHYSEALLPLPGIGTRYARPAVNTDRTRAHFRLPTGRVLLLVPQSAFKILPDNDALLADILAAVPEADLLLFADMDVENTQAVEARITHALRERGVCGSERIRRLPRMEHADYMAVNTLADLMLDTLHWSGGNTSLDALSVGLPVVTLPGRFMRGRQSAAMLRRVGVPELIARDPSDYVAIAVHLARSPLERAALRSRIAAGADRLFDDRAPVAALCETLLRLAAAPHA